MAAATTMRALRLTRETPTSVPKLTLETTTPKPTLSATDPKKLLIKVHASAIHPSDVMNTIGAFPYTQFPRIPGRDFAGVVASAPTALSHLVGTKVYGTSGPEYAFTKDGFQAEFALVDVDDVAPMPGNLTFAQAAVLGVPFTTAKLTLSRAGAKKGETVLVLGANGAVGSVVVQIAKEMGCTVLKGARGKDGDVDTTADPELKKVMELTGGKGVDVIINTVGSPELMGAAMKVLALRGRLAYIAAPRTGGTEIGVEMLGFYRLEKSLIGVNSLTYSAAYMAVVMKELSPSFESGVLKAPAEGEWTPITLEKAGEAYKALLEKTTKEKFVVVME